MSIWRTRLTLVLLAAVVGGCSGDRSVAVSPTPTPSPSLTGDSPSTPFATLTPSPSSSVSSTANPLAAPGPLTLDWTRTAGDVGLGDLQEIRAWTNYQGHFVIVGQRNVKVGPDTTCCASAIWTSDDALHWTLATVDGASSDLVEIRDLTIGGSGLVAVGDESTDSTVTAAVWLSTDGRHWDRVASDGFSPGRMLRVGGTMHGLVAFGDDCSCIYSDVVAAGADRGRDLMWTSVDGVTWQRAISPVGLTLGPGGVLINTNDEHTALVTAWQSPDAATRPIEVWRTTDGTGWKRVGELPGSAGADVWRVAGGTTGYVAIGTRIWISPDAIRWTVSSSASPGPVSDLLALPNGFVAVGARSTATGCAIPEGAFIGQTWVSADGQSWREIVPKPAWVGQGVTGLFQTDQSIVGVGRSFATASGLAQGAVWTTNLSGSTVDGRPAAASPIPSPNPGCGP
jgi:hypothetical protein